MSVVTFNTFIVENTGSDKIKDLEENEKRHKIGSGEFGALKKGEKQLSMCAREITYYNKYYLK